MCPKDSLGDEGGAEYGGPRIFQNSTFFTWGLCIIFIVFFKKDSTAEGKVQIHKHNQLTTKNWEEGLELRFPVNSDCGEGLLREKGS